MTDAVTAAEKAIFAALTTAVDWDVYQHVPQDTPPPVVIIGDMVATEIGTKNDPDRRIDLQVLTVFQGEARKPVTERQQMIRDALNGITLIESGFRITSNETSARAELLEDGETYIGTSNFTVWALAA